MKISSRGIELIKSFEGLVTTAYRCQAGVLTIGYGHTYNVYQGQTISREEAEQLLARDLVWAEECVSSKVKKPLNQNQFDALVSFVFNVGPTNFHNSTLLRVINADPGNYDAVVRQLKRWNHAGGVISKGLTRRRDAEAKLYTCNVD